jgi:hypothetical protein
MADVLVAVCVLGKRLLAHANDLHASIVALVAQVAPRRGATCAMTSATDLRCMQFAPPS